MVIGPFAMVVVLEFFGLNCFSFASIHLNPALFRKTEIYESLCRIQMYTMIGLSNKLHYNRTQIWL